MASQFKSEPTPQDKRDIQRHEAVVVSVYKMCDFCTNAGIKRVAQFDGKTSSRLGGSWANMCPIHWKNNGCGALGTGFGQRLVYVRENG